MENVIFASFTQGIVRYPDGSVIHFIRQKADPTNPTNKKGKTKAYVIVTHELYKSLELGDTNG